MFNHLTRFKPLILWRNRTAWQSMIQDYSRIKFVSQSSFSSNNTLKNGATLQTRIQDLLNKSFPKAQEIIVKDISGGCGFMFEIYVVSIDFEGMPKVKQHLAVSNILKEEIKDMHGIRIFTEVPATSEL